MELAEAEARAARNQNTVDVPLHHNTHFTGNDQHYNSNRSVAALGDRNTGSFMNSFNNGFNGSTNNSSYHGGISLENLMMQNHEMILLHRWNEAGLDYYFCGCGHQKYICS